MVVRCTCQFGGIVTELWTILVLRDALILINRTSTLAPRDQAGLLPGSAHIGIVGGTVCVGITIGISHCDTFDICSLTAVCIPGETLMLSSCTLIVFRTIVVAHDRIVNSLKTGRLSLIAIYGTRITYLMQSSLAGKCQQGRNHRHLFLLNI